MHSSITPERVAAAMELNELRGFCNACGKDAHNVERDARHYTCEHCGEAEVFGADEFFWGL